MYSHETHVRVRYAETDQMGVVYYGNYAAYYEVARVEALRNLGMTYREMEASGVMMPVLELKCKYIRPAKYDELLRIKVLMPAKPTVRMLFNYEVYNEEGVLINVGETTLVFIDMKSNKPCMAPTKMLEKMASYYA